VPGVNEADLFIMPIEAYVSASLLKPCQMHVLRTVPLAEERDVLKRSEVLETEPSGAKTGRTGGLHRAWVSPTQIVFFHI
jgi:hypothetical protein